MTSVCGPASVPFVVVGIDGSPAAERALDWAADDAALRRAQLRIGYAWALVAHRLPEAAHGDLVVAARGAAEHLLARAARGVRERHPGLDVVIELLPDVPAVSLPAAAEHAQLLVVGARGLNTFASLLLGSVSHAVAAHARCPVAVVRTAAEGEGARKASGVVVLGVAPDEVSGPVEFAFAEAQRRGVPVHAVRSWMYPQTLPGEVVVPVTEEAEINRRENEELDAALAAARTSFPDVPVVTEVGLAEPELVSAAAGAALVVVGRGPPPVGRRARLGPVSQAVIHHAVCAVAIVPG